MVITYITNICQKSTNQIGQKKVMWLKTFKILEDLNGEETVESFMKKSCKKQLKRSLELKKIIKKRR